MAKKSQWSKTHKDRLINCPLNTGFVLPVFNLSEFEMSDAMLSTKDDEAIYLKVRVGDNVFVIDGGVFKAAATNAGVWDDIIVDGDLLQFNTLGIHLASDGKSILLKRA